MAKTDLERLRKGSDRVLRLPTSARQVVEAYFHIRVGKAVAACPYHINPGVWSANRALLGKGNPAEIEAAAAVCFERYAMPSTADPEQLRNLLLACGIGVDCSGFAAWVLNAHTKAVLSRSLWSCVKFPGLKRRAVSTLRPVQNISANLLTNSRNARSVEDLAQVRPGDLIRASGGHHVLVIIEVGLDSSGDTGYFQYAQSSCMYGSSSGVRTGYVMIKKPRGPLLAQEWFDNYEQNIIEELIAESEGDNRIVRLRALVQSANP